MESWKKEYLAHHGILGQKWGVRRFQNADGSLKPAGKKRKSKYRINLENKYKKGGLSKEDAEREADKKIRIQKGIAAGAIAAGVTVAGIMAYKRYGEEYVGKTIKSGVTLQTLTHDKDRISKGQDYYAAYTKGDKKIYKAMFGRDMDIFGRAVGDAKYNIKQTVNGGLKVAPNKAAREAFVEMYKNDKGVREYVKNNSKLLRARNSAKALAGKDNLSDKQIKKVYSVYNQLLVQHTPEAEKYKTAFYKKLGDKGFDAVLDLNDRHYSGFNAKSPIVVFNKGKAATNDLIKRLDIKEVDRARNVYIGKQLAKNLAIQTLPVAALVAGLNANDDYDAKVIAKNRKGDNNGKHSNKH